MTPKLAVTVSRSHSTRGQQRRSIPRSTHSSVPLVDVALATVPVSDAGAASGTYSIFQQLGAAIGVAISTTIFFGIVGDDWARGNVLTALNASVWVSVIGFGIAGVASLLLPNRQRVQTRLAEEHRLREAKDDAAAERHR